MRKVTALFAVLLAVALMAPRVEAQAQQSVFQSMMDDPRIVVYTHGNVEVHSIVPFTPGDLEKMSLAWDLITELPRWPGLGDSIPKPVRIYYVDGEKLYQLYRSRVEPCPVGQECSSSGYYEGSTDQILINGDQRWHPVWQDSTHEMAHRMLGWVATGQDCTRYGWANFCQSPVKMNGMRDAVARLNREMGSNPNPAVLQVDRYARLVQILREDFFPGWPLEGVELITFEGTVQSYRTGNALTMEEWAAYSFVKSVVNQFDSHAAGTYPTFGAAVDYVEAEVERICRKRGGC